MIAITGIDASINSYGINHKHPLESWAGKEKKTLKFKRLMTEMAVDCHTLI